MGEPLGENQSETEYDDDDDGDEYDDDYDQNDEYDDDEIRQEMSLQFHGETADYFRIWIVNLCLTLATLGVFSAWAKVRKKRFFYSHIKLAGTPFQYLGQPLPILKGRLIGVSLLAIWYLSENFWVQFVPVVLLFGVVLAPWVIVRSLAFNARYSAYRNQTFSFAARYRDAAGVLIRCALTIVFTLGFGYPWAEARFKRFMVVNTSYGGKRGRFLAAGGHYAPVYLVTFGGVLVTTIAVGLFAYELISAGKLVLGSYVVFLFSGITYVVYAVAYAYRQAKVTNLVWNSTELGPIRFSSNLRFKRLLFLYVTNLLAIAGTLGLAIPWATMRIVRYRVQCMRVYCAGALDEFVGQRSATVRAVGAEVADVFDLDIAV